MFFKSGSWEEKLGSSIAKKKGETKKNNDSVQAPEK
jgi:hypothetical protein